MSFSVTNLVMFVLSSLLLTNVAFGATEEVTSLGKTPRAIAINPDTNMIYVASAGSKIISVIDGSTRQVTANIRAGNSLEGLAVNPATDTLYATNYWPKKVSIIDASTNSLVKKIDVQEYPLDIVVNPGTNLVYVAGKKIPEVLDNTIYIIDGQQNTIADTIKIKGSPVAMTINPHLNLLYIATTINETSTLQAIDLRTKSIDHTIDIVGTISMAVNTNTNMIYLNHGWGVSVINGTSKTKATAIAVGGEPEGITVNPTTNMIYVSNFDIGAVTVINGTTNFAQPLIQVGHNPVEVAINPDENVLYVTNAGSDTVSVIDASTNTVIDTIGKERQYDCSKLKIRSEASEYEVSSKFGEEFYQKIKSLLEAGETRSYAVYIWVNEFDEEDNDSTRLNKQKVECLLRHLGATNIYPARVFEWVSARIPLDQLFMLASYPFIDLVDDAEIEEVPLGNSVEWSVYKFSYEEQEFRIPYKITNGNLILIEVDPTFTSMFIQIDGDGGIIEITIPRDLIDAKELESNEDDSFVVLVDGEEQNYEEVNNSPCFRTISIKFPKGEQEIEITAGYLSPRAITTIPPSVYIDTDKDNYGKGEVIMVSGCTSLSIDDKELVLEILNPDGKTYRTISITPNIDGSFSTSFVVEGYQAINGTYVARATYAGESAMSTFVVPEFPVSVLIASLAVGLMVVIMRLRSLKLY